MLFEELFETITEPISKVHESFLLFGELQKQRLAQFEKDYIGILKSFEFNENDQYYSNHNRNNQSIFD